MTWREVRAWLLQLPRHPAGHCQERADRVVCPPGQQSGHKATWNISAFKYKQNNWCPITIGIQKSNTLDFSWKQLRRWTFTANVLHIRQKPHAKNKQHKTNLTSRLTTLSICSCIYKRVTSLTCDTLNKTCLSVRANKSIIHVQPYVFCRLVSAEFWPWVTSNTMQIHEQQVHTALIASPQLFPLIRTEQFTGMFWESLLKLLFPGQGEIVISLVLTNVTLALQNSNGWPHVVWVSWALWWHKKGRARSSGGTFFVSLQSWLNLAGWYPHDVFIISHPPAVYL